MTFVVSNTFSFGIEKPVYRSIGLGWWRLVGTRFCKPKASSTDGAKVSASPSELSIRDPRA
jgi:hypothetical protein